MDGYKMNLAEVFDTALNMYSMAAKSRMPGAEKIATAIAQDLFEQAGMGGAIPKSVYATLESSVNGMMQEYVGQNGSPLRQDPMRQQASGGDYGLLNRIQGAFDAFKCQPANQDAHRSYY
ncbi:hypothetical protein COV93_00365 [Candidatus Woesearchaeota archaeon CG11_big_fil_rev_8_21_14_0_20_43_8]|nr:MAG: hypothetical protein COV93_00365 [Candidatus Woesearchaeota archaeon CG11_big_fil_rev_8_21_14_0_20_43_8]